MSPFKSPEPKPSSFVKKFTRPNAAWSQPEAAEAYLKWEHEEELRREREEIRRRTLAKQKKAAAEERAQRKAAASASSSKTISSANRRELQAVLDVLEGVKKSSDGFSALCPAHDDTRPSLSISLGDDGRLLAHCFADCSFEEIMTAIRERRTRSWCERQHHCSRRRRPARARCCRQTRSSEFQNCSTNMA